MYKLNEISNILKLKIKLNKYGEAIEILKKEIIEIYVLKIKEIDKSFKYTNIINLIDKAEQTLNHKYITQLKKYFCIINDECSQEYELSNLIEIYSNIRSEKNEI